MKKTIITVALATMLGTSVMADDFDNTAMKMTAVTEDYSISIKAPKTGATEFSIGGEVASLDTSVTWKRNGEVDNYAIKAGKSMELGMTPMYAGASAKFSFGDSFNTDTRTLDLSPYVGVAHTMGKLTPFAEVGYAWQSTQKDIIDINRDSSYLEVGASYALSEAVSAKVTVSEARDIDFANPGDRNAEIGLTFKF
jgi:hypothetical protein